MNSLINIYGRIISGGGKGTVSDLEHARQMINPNMPLTAVEGALEGYEFEIGVAQRAPGKIRAQIRSGGGGGEETAPAGAGRGNLPAGATPTSGGPSGTTSTGISWSVE